MTQPVLSSWTATENLHSAMAREANEQFRLLFFDSMSSSAGVNPPASGRWA